MGGGSAGAAAPSPTTEPAVELHANTLVAIDPDTLKPTRSISVGDQPDSVVVEGSIAWTANTGERSVTWINLDGTETKTIPVDIGGGLRIVGDGTGGVWAFDGAGSRTISHLSGTRLKVDRHLHLPASPAAIVFMQDGSAWETTGFGLSTDSYAIRFDPETGKELARVEVQPAPVFAEEGLGSLWVLAYEGQELDRIDTSQARVQASITIPTSPFGLAVGESDVWVGTYSASRVFHVDPVHATIDGEVPTGFGTVLLVADGNRLWVANRDRSVDLIDVERRKVVGSVDLGFALRGAAVDESGELWLTLSPV